MSKQADEEQPSIYDILDPVVSEYASNKCWTNGFKSCEEVYEAAMEHLSSQLTPNHLVEQKCLETRIKENAWASKRPHGGQADINELAERRKKLESQLTNLQNKEK